MKNNKTELRIQGFSKIVSSFGISSDMGEMIDLEKIYKSSQKNER